MRHARVLGTVALATLALAAVAFAQTTPSEPPAEATPPAAPPPPTDPGNATVTPLQPEVPVQTSPIDSGLLEAAMVDTQWGDATAGQAKAAVCAACHGVDGNPADPQYPRLAGQNERYIARQLALYKTGERQTAMAAIMRPYALPLSAQDMRDIGAYYASQVAGAGIADDSVVAEGPYADMQFYEVGQQLYRNGDAQRGIPACMACHGPAGAGNPGPPYPHVGGQNADYTVRMLTAFRDGLVLGEGDYASPIMADVAENLTDLEIQSLASYLQGLHPRQPVAQGG